METFTAHPALGGPSPEVGDIVLLTQQYGPSTPAVIEYGSPFFAADASPGRKAYADGATIEVIGLGRVIDVEMETRRWATAEPVLGTAEEWAAYERGDVITETRPTGRITVEAMPSPQR